MQSDSDPCCGTERMKFMQRLFTAIAEERKPHQGPREAGFVLNEGERGSALVEFALTLPIAMTVLTALLAFGVYMNKSLEMTNATSMAGQFLAMNRGMAGASDPCSTVATAFQNVSPYLNQGALNFSFSITGSLPPFSGSYTGTSCAPATAGMTQGAVATISVTYPCNIGIFGVELAPGCTLRSQVTEIIQ
jgi:Flp pilus assembly protein TadG